MRLLACLLLVLLAVPSRALDEDDAADDAAEAGARLRAIDDAAQRDADYPEVAGEEAPDVDEPVDEAAQEPRDPYDDEDAVLPQSSRRATPRTPPPAKPESYPNVLESKGPASQAPGGKGTGGKGAEPTPSPLDVED